jgi:hypothetical protein
VIMAHKFIIEFSSLPEIACCGFVTANDRGSQICDQSNGQRFYGADEENSFHVRAKLTSHMLRGIR